MVVKARWAEFVISFGRVAIFAFYPQPRASELMWRAPYDNQSRAAGPVGIGRTPQQLASQYKEQRTGKSTKNSSFTKEIRQ
jgi:hypothetical protein